MEHRSVHNREAPHSHSRRTKDGYDVYVTYHALPVMGEEIALLRTFLDGEVLAILRGEDEG